jgi:hypothetical protein
MAYTQADLEKLDRAIAGSQLEVQYDGKRVRFRSTDELMRARAHVERELSTGKGRPRQFRLRSAGKGIR